MKKTALLILTTVSFAATLQAKTLKEVDPSVYNYDVLFTNPTCTTKFYQEDIYSQSGKLLTQKPENVFCDYNDANVTGKRDGSDLRIGKNESPQHRLLKLISDKETKELFMTYLSFSDKKVTQGLCDRLKKGDLKLTLVLDKMNEQGSIDRMLTKFGADADKLRADTKNKYRPQFLKKLAQVQKTLRSAVEADEAGEIELRNESIVTYRNLLNPKDPISTIDSDEELTDSKKLFKAYRKLLTSSHYLNSSHCANNNKELFKVKRMAKPGGIGWSHTKVFMVNPYDTKKVTLAFSSANMSSGTTIHHENWHFVTSSSNSHFVQSHKCLIEGELNNADSKKEFVKFMKECRENLKDQDGNSIGMEDDIKTFFVPGEGEAAIATIVKGIKSSKNISMAAHRFTHKTIRDALKKAAGTKGSKVKMVFDDDMYLAGEGILNKDVRVPNMPFEYNNVKVVLSGDKRRYKKTEARYMETNHYAHTIHHNKYLIFDNARNKNLAPAVFAGAGNFTKAAFSMKSAKTNLENYYYITIPEVVDAFKKQYDYVWNELATKYKDLPTKDVQPK